MELQTESQHGHHGVGGKPEAAGGDDSSSLQACPQQDPQKLHQVSLSRALHDPLVPGALWRGGHSLTVRSFSTYWAPTVCLTLSWAVNLMMGRMNKIPALTEGVVKLRRQDIRKQKLG